MENAVGKHGQEYTASWTPSAVPEYTLEQVKSRNLGQGFSMCGEVYKIVSVVQVTGVECHAMTPVYSPSRHHRGYGARSGAGHV